MDRREKTDGPEEMDGPAFPAREEIPDPQVTKALPGSACQDRGPMVRRDCAAPRVTPVFRVSLANQAKTAVQGQGETIAATARQGYLASSESQATMVVKALTARWDSPAVSVRTERKETEVTRELGALRAYRVETANRASTARRARKVFRASTFCRVRYHQTTLRASQASAETTAKGALPV